MQQTLSRSNSRSVQMNSVLKNAFLGVGVELTVYTLAMIIGMQMNMGSGAILLFVPALIIMFILPKFANSWTGFALANALAGFLGLAAAPMLNYYVQGGYIQEIFMAAATTGAITYGLSVYAMNTKRDFSFMGGFLVAALIGLIVINIINLFIGSTILSLAMSYVGVLIFSGFILFEVNSVANQRNGNWILASVSIFLSIINLFWNILSILGLSSD